MKKISLAASVVFAGIIWAAPGSHAAVLVQDNFDGYADQAAFLAAWPAVGATASGTLSTAQAQSPPNSINYAATPAQRNERTFTESGVPAADSIVVFSFDFYDANADLNPYRQYANLQDGAGPSSGGQLVSMGLNNNLISTAEGGNYYMARILGFNANAYFKLNDTGAPLRSTGWHNLAVEISPVDFKFYVDGILSETVLQSAAGSVLRSYDVVRLGSGLTSTSEAFFDNVRIETVPEPSSSMVAVLGLSACLLRRRRAVTAGSCQQTVC